MALPLFFTTYTFTLGIYPPPMQCIHLLANRVLHNTHPLPNFATINNTINTEN